MAPASLPETVPCVTAAQMQDVDRLATEKYRLHVLQRMENAGRHFAALARDEFLGGDVRNHTVLVVCGSGGNGGGGLVAARHLHNWGATVWVYTVNAPGNDGVPAHQVALLRRMEVPVEPVGSEINLPGADLILDALMGYGFDGALRDPMGEFIHSVLWHGAPALSLDVPSGLNPTTGVPSTNTVHAEATLALGLPKCGLEAPAAESAVGDLYLADIGMPPALYDDLDLNDDVTDLFAQTDRVRLR